MGSCKTLISTINLLTNSLLTVYILPVFTDFQLTHAEIKTFV